MSTYSKILIPIDFSDHSAEALRHACDLARRFDSELHLLHVLESAAPVAYTELYPAYEAILASRRSEAEHLLKGLPPLGLGPKPVVRHVVAGAPAIEIVNYADANGVELIVMGTHGRTGFKAWMTGSVAERVVRFAHCPVLVVRPHTTASGVGSVRSA